MINSTLFSFQRTISLHLSELCGFFRESASISYLIHSSLSRTFCSFSHPEIRLGFLSSCSQHYWCCSLTTCIIIHAFISLVNTFIKRSKKECHSPIHYFLLRNGIRSVCHVFALITNGSVSSMISSSTSDTL